MKIALLGAPGSNKTEVALRLARNLNRDRTGLRWVVIDSYVDALEVRTGREYDMAADIPHNVQIMAERWTKEAEALHRGDSTITCGSIYETIVYTALTRLTPPADEGELMQFMHEAQTAMQFLGLMEEMTFNYDALFLLGQAKPNDHTWYNVINTKLPEVLEGAFRYAVPLHEETTRQKVKHALAVIRFIRDPAEPAEAPADQ